MIDKLPVRVGGPNEVEPISTLPMFRKFISFEGSLEKEYIVVYYEEWLESGTAKLELKLKSYIVQDIPEIGHTIPGDPNTTPPTTDEYVVDVPAYNSFSEGWFYKKVKATSNGLSIGGNIIAPLDYELNFGKDMIAAVINATLIAMDFNIEDRHLSQP
jgi:hypothetical protein